MASKKTKEDEGLSKHTNKGGRPVLDFDYELLAELLLAKVRKEFVVDRLKVSEKTLDRRIKDKFGLSYTEYHNVRLQHTGYLIQQKLIDLALGGNVTAGIYVSKNICGWSDNPPSDDVVNRSISISYNVVKRKDD